MPACQTVQALCPDHEDPPPCLPEFGCECHEGDNSQGDDCGSCSDALGMPVWWVSEPYINLRIEDVPLRYPRAKGGPVGFRLSYRQRGNLPEEPNIFSVGQNWSFNLRAFVVVLTNLTDGWVRQHVGGAGGLDHYHNRPHRWQVSKMGYGTVHLIGGGTRDVYTVEYRNGAIDYYGEAFTGTSGTRPLTTPFLMPHCNLALLQLTMGSIWEGKSRRCGTALELG